jgi:hypothetical protein
MASKTNTSDPEENKASTNLSSFPKLPHVEAGANLFVLNALETVVENNAQRVFDFIGAEDVVLHFLKTPACFTTC